MDDLNKYKKFLLNRVTLTQPLFQYLENYLATDNESMKHSFHKIMIHNWTDNSTNLFEVLSSYFGIVFIPVNYMSQSVLTTFYTSSITFILKIIKLEFMFPYSRSMFNIDILLNDKKSSNIFKVDLTIDDIVTKVVSLRFNQNFELNLSNFINDEAFVQKKINFYRLSLLAHFKILMLRMGRDTKILNLSNNNLSQIPLEILNFFIKGDLIEVNLSNNNIPSITELQRISSKVEKLWVEGNPLCEDLEPMSYIKQISLKFPRLTELDGIKLNQYGVTLPFYNNFLIVPDKKTKVIVEKFVSLYFSHYDSDRQKLDMFYDRAAQMTLSASFSDVDHKEPLEHYLMHSRNILDPQHRVWDFKQARVYKSRSSIVSVFSQLPHTTHDTTTFTVDVLKHDSKVLTLIIDGFYKEILDNGAERFMHFRRTFMFEIYSVNAISFYNVVCEMFSVSFATPEMIQNSLQNPVRHLNQMTLINPGKDERDIICAVFIYYTQLKKSEAESRLLYHDWDVRVALKAFALDLKNNRISQEKFMLEEEMSDISSLLDDEVD